MHVLVTGLQGFTGQYVRRELVEHGHQVTGLQADLTDLPDIKQEIAHINPDAVIHLGGISFVNNTDSNLMYQVNLLGTRHLLTALSEHAPHVQSIILASTAHVYGNNAASILSEDTALQPANDYAVSKLSMEYMASLWRDKLPITIVRPFNYTGVGQAEYFLIPKIVAHFKKRSPTIELGNIDVAREFGDVRSVAQIYRKILESRTKGDTINICTGKAYTLREVMAVCQATTGHQIEINVNPLFVRTNEVHSLAGDNTHLRAIIGRLPNILLNDTLEWMIGTH